MIRLYWRSGFLLVAAALSIAATSGASWEPVAVAGLGRDRLAVLSGYGELDLIVSGSRKQIWKLESGLKPIDMGGVASGDSYAVVISSVMRKATGDVVGALDVRPSGQSLRTIGAIYSGVALSSRQPSVGFVANSRSREILSMAIDAKGIALKVIARVPDEGAILGPLALDSTAQRIYVADLTRGAIWFVPANGGQPTLFATGLRDLRALAADDTSVFAADGDGQRVLQFAQHPPQATAAQKSSSSRRVPLDTIKVPSAVAITGAGQIAVGDSRLGEVRVIDVASGRVTRRIS